MAEDVKALKQQIEDLKSELMAERQRQGVGVVASKPLLKQRVKEKIKRSILWKIADDPNSKMGKVIRSPRTIFRIVVNPSVIKDIRARNGHIKEKKETNKQDIFAPVKFFVGEDTQIRINVVLEGEDLDLVKTGIMLANEKKVELRIITTKERFDSVIYGKMVRAKQIPRANNISFYDAVEQYGKAKMFELEVSRGDIFLTRAWNKND